MAKKYRSTADVIAAVKRLEDDSGMRALRDDVKNREHQHDMTREVAMPAHMVVSGYTPIKSLRIQDLAQKLMAFMGAYPTTTTVTPGGPELQSKADKAERTLALVRADLFEDEKRAKMRWWQLIGAYGVYKLVCAARPKEGWGKQKPWTVKLVDPNSCFFTLTDAPIRPSVMGRRFTMLGREIQGAYTDEDKGTQPAQTNGVWGIEPMSVEVATDEEGNTHRESGADDWLYKSYDVVELDDGECTYTVVMNADKKTGTLVWRYENLVNGTHYVVVPGHVTGSMQPREALLPYLWGPMNVVDQLTTIRTIRATSFTAKDFKVLVERNPEFYRAGIDLGVLKMATEAQMAAADDDVFEVNGKAVVYQRKPNEDMDKLEQALEREYAEMASTQLSVTTSDVVKEGTLGAQQLAVGQREKQQGPMLAFEDKAEKLILEMVVASVLHEDGYVPDKSEGWGYYAQGEVEYGKGKLEAGTRMYLTRDMFDFEHFIDVTTASDTPEQIALDVQQTIQAYQLNFATTDEVLNARRIKDIAAWHKAHGEDEAYKWAAQNVPANFYQQLLKEMLLIEGGININVPAEFAQFMQPAAPVPNGGQQPAPPPATAGVGGEPPQEFAA